MDSETLFMDNQRLVGLALRRLRIYPDNDLYDDYKQVGYIGLLKATKKLGLRN